MTASSIALALLFASSTPAAEAPLVIRATKNMGNAQSVAISADGKFVAAGFGGPLQIRAPKNTTRGGVFVCERKPASLSWPVENSVTSSSSAFHAIVATWPTLASTPRGTRSKPTTRCWSISPRARWSRDGEEAECRLLSRRPKT